ncbi:hypothetical protein K458DRAFT_407445 [Lentithecium fluviatile CBS 122367]|uniref:Uncharacterized protein n=1 Tax=Lentithecium fluviatile CBS 122367 TaxID=1168545 RepID=A0A6G1IPD7_9PLEO|nr:hypothetical protein K458DRAFT_407445 [Lentithecium fluviatile CBS 122367]
MASRTVAERGFGMACCQIPAIGGSGDRDPPIPDSTHGLRLICNSLLMPEPLNANRSYHTGSKSSMGFTRTSIQAIVAFCVTVNRVMSQTARPACFVDIQGCRCNRRRCCRPNRKYVMRSGVQLTTLSCCCVAATVVTAAKNGTWEM